jgi:2-keto-3-deoxy-L-rhamnonate aldolase RhmA
MILIPEMDTTVGKRDAAVRLERAIGPYYVFRDAGVEVVLVSPDGGSPSMEFTAESDGSTEVMERLKRDRAALDEFSDTIGLDQVYIDDFDAAFCVGHPGAIWRPKSNNSAAGLIARLLDAGKPVAVLPSGIDLDPKGASDGLLIVGDGSKSSIMVAQALLGALHEPHTKPERNVS